MPSKKESTRTPSYFWLIPTLLLLMVASGCQSWSPRLGLFCKAGPVEVDAVSPQCYRLFVSPNYRSAGIRRIAVLEAGPSVGNYDANGKLASELANQIRNLALYEVVVPRERMYSVPDNILNGSFDEAELAGIARAYNADGVLLVRVNELKAHEPLRASATVSLIDCYESVVVWGVDGSWDLAHPGVRAEFQNFVQNHAGQSVNPNLLAQSPAAVFQFAATQMAREMANSN